MVQTNICRRGSSFHGQNHRSIWGEVDWIIAAIHHGLGTPSGRTRGARHNEYVQDTVKVAALKTMMPAEMAERYIEGLQHVR